MKKVLLVEDSAFQAAKTRLDLEERGFEVAVAYNGETALKTVGVWQPDIIVLDYILPDTDGIEICRQLKRSPCYKNIPVVLFSSENKLTNMTQAYSAGADSYLVKGLGGENALEVLMDSIFLRRNLLPKAV